MLRSAAARTGQALAPAVTGLEGTYESLPVSMHPGRFGENPPDAIERFLRGQGYSPEQAHELAYGPADAGAAGLESTETFSEPLPGLERIIGRDMLLQVDYLEAGCLSAAAVGRVLILKGNGGYGTGFLISPRLLITNNHVLSSSEMAARSQVEFDYQRNLDGGLGPSNVFDLDPAAFFVTSPVKELDFTIVAVKPEGSGAKALAEYGHHPLTAVEDEVLAGACVSIIQHPKGDPKQVVLRDNEVLKLPDSGATFLHYKSGTHPGSSGSPVFNDVWEVIALHHAGKPETDADHNPLLVDGTRWKPGDSLDRIKWIANEGIRVAAIIDFVKKQGLEGMKNELFAEALKPRPLFRPSRDARETPPEGGSEAASRPVTRRSSDGEPTSTIIPTKTNPPAPEPEPTPVSRPEIASGSTTISVPIVLTFQIGTPSVSRAMPVPTARPEVDLSAFEKIEIDPDYSNREGYRDDFLGTGPLRVPLPRPSAVLAAQLVASAQPTQDGPKYELTYHHFSVALHRKRHLAAFTAVNIDGSQPRPPLRDKDRWIFDPRVDSSLQIGNQFYKKPFDRGHLVRRLDPAWGRTSAVAKQANDDTFHFTNCSPQHARFNEGKALWAGLEDYLLEKANSDAKRIIVFTGPVFADDDPVLDGETIPLKFWKVAAALNPAGKLVSAGFVVSQEELVRPMVEEVSAEQVARMYQLPVAEVSRLCGLDFGPLAAADPAGRPGFFEATGGPPRELEGYEQIELG